MLPLLQGQPRVWNGDWWLYWEFLISLWNWNVNFRLHKTFQYNTWSGCPGAIIKLLQYYNDTIILQIQFIKYNRNVKENCFCILCSNVKRLHHFTITWIMILHLAYLQQRNETCFTPCSLFSRWNVADKEPAALLFISSFPSCEHYGSAFFLFYSTYFNPTLQAP